MGNLNYYFSKVGCGNDTTCVRSTKLELIKQNLISILGKEGYNPIAQPSLPLNSDSLIEELFSSSYKTQPYLWVIGLLASNSGWTTIKTSVEDLLCRKANSNNSRLSELAVLSNCDIFHHSFNNRHLGVLVEANSSGKTLVTGYNTECDDIDNMQFYNEPIIEPKGRQKFYLLDVPEAFQTAGKTAINLGKQEKQTKNEELERLFQQGDEKQRKKAIAEWKELNMGGRERFDSDLGNLICRSNFFWHEDNLFHKAYAKPKQLEQNEVKLLFFQVGRFDLDPSKEEIWLPIENFNWRK